MNSALQRMLNRLPAPLTRWMPLIFSATTGAAAALMLYFLFYRIDLPSKPFIYVAF